MKYTDLMEHIDYRGEKIAEFVGASTGSIFKWRQKRSIPFLWQCKIEVLTQGKLKARQEDE